MGTIIKGSQSGYAGFLNGYIAGNLSANSQELHFHLDKIEAFLKELRVEVDKWDLNNNALKKNLDDQFNGLIELLINKENKIDYYVKVGDGIFELVSLMVSIKPEMPSNSNFLFKKIVYHYLNIAKTSKNANITRLAKKIAEKHN